MFMPYIQADTHDAQCTCNAPPLNTPTTPIHDAYIRVVYLAVMQKRVSIYSWDCHNHIYGPLAKY